jgi:hypothetical protein
MVIGGTPHTCCDKHRRAWRVKTVGGGTPRPEEGEGAGIILV